MVKPTVCINSHGQQAISKSKAHSDTDRSVVQVKMGLFDTLAMVSLWVGQAEESLLEEGTMSRQQLDLTAYWQGADALLLVPKGKSNILEAVGVADSGDAIFAPSVGPGTCVIVGEILWRGFLSVSM